MTLDEICTQLIADGLNYLDSPHSKSAKQSVDEAKQAIREAVERAEPVYAGGTRDMHERNYKKIGVADFKENLLRELGLDDQVRKVQSEEDHQTISKAES